MQTGDILTEAEVLYIEALEGLWDMLSDAIEGGRLTEADLLDDYSPFVNQMQRCENLRFLSEQ